MNVVVVGAWNQAIFTPEWMKNHVLPGNGALETYISLGAIHSVRFLTERLTIEIAPGRLQVGANSADIEDLGRIEDVVRRILELLTHTPVQALGVNVDFGSTTAAPVPFSREIALDFGKSLIGHSSTWTIADGSDEFNIRMNQPLDGPVATTVNVHRPTASAELACEALAQGLKSPVARARQLVAKFWAN